MNEKEICRQCREKGGIGGEILSEDCTGWLCPIQIPPTRGYITTHDVGEIPPELCPHKFEVLVALGMAISHD